MFEFLEMMLESSRRSARRGALDDFAGHVRIAVPVTANPRTRPQDRFRQEPWASGQRVRRALRTSALIFGITSNNAAS